MADGYADDIDASDGDDDDIARFERACAERARNEGLTMDDEDDGLRSDEEDPGLVRARLVQGKGPDPVDAGEWQKKCQFLQEKLSRKDAELAQVKGDLDLLRSEGIGANDPQVELKQRLVDLSKKNRRLQVSVESQKVRLQQLEAEARKPKEEIRKQAEELVMANQAALMGDGGNMEDWKKKYLTASNKLQETRQEVQEMRQQLQKYKKVMLKELGGEDAMQQAISVADDPNASQWKGRAAQISQLQRQVRELKDKVAAGVSAQEDGSSVAVGSAPSVTMAPASAAAAAAAANQPQPRAIAQAAEKRREEFERLQEEVERLRAEQADCKRKREALKSRSTVLSTQVSELKASTQLLVRKSDDDDALVELLRKQLGGSSSSRGGESSEEISGLRQQNSELQAQLERQAQIVVQLRQKSLAASCENGSNRLGPRSVEGGTSEQQLIERVRYLEAEAVKQSEQVRLYREQLGEDLTNNGRPFSAGNTLNPNDKLRQLQDRLSAAERENQALRSQQAHDSEGPDGSPRSDSGSRCGSRSGSRGPGAPGSEQLLRQNEALKREIVRLRSQVSNRSPSPGAD
eukprot:TRINITY_DN4957_c0_g1_i2.p1 TRINITY_DN4957_c0_g1~~TRINITY_DN4957_c0_g1_i2.p1  ORF type:complete len:594 (-),score=148.79 TRINITY_DN4957_c0_g1_i2:177-1904(-)